MISSEFLMIAYDFSRIKNLSARQTADHPGNSLKSMSRSSVSASPRMHRSNMSHWVSNWKNTPNEGSNGLQWGPMGENGKTNLCDALSLLGYFHGKYVEIISLKAPGII